jgi:hypothetical protein
MPKTVDIQKLFKKLVAIRGDWSESSNSASKIETNYVKNQSLMHQIFLRRIGGGLENPEAELTTITIDDLSTQDTNSLRQVIRFIGDNEVSETQTAAISPSNNAVEADITLAQQPNAEVVVSESGGSVLSMLSYVFCCVCLYGTQQGALNSGMSGKYGFGGSDGHDDNLTG